MSHQAIDRLGITQAVVTGELHQWEAARRLDLTILHVNRLVCR